MVSLMKLHVTKTCCCLAVIVLLVGCEHPDPRQGMLSDSFQVQQVFLKNALQFQWRINDQKLKSASKVELTVEDAVQSDRSELDVRSVKIELKPVFEGESLTLEVPVSNQFRTGIWHVPEIRFYEPTTKKWKALREGDDFAGIPFRLVNSAEVLRQDSAPLTLETVKSIAYK